MTQTIFRQEMDRKGPVISFLLLELLEEERRAAGEAVDLGQQLDMVYRAGKKAGMQFADQAIEDGGRAVALDILARLARRADAGAPSGEPEPVKNGKVMADYLSSLSPFDTCMLIAAYDIEKARMLYCAEDFESVLSAAKSCFTRTMIDYYSMQEAVGIAFGGTPADGDESHAEEHKPVVKAIKVSEMTVEQLNKRLGEALPKHTKG